MRVRFVSVASLLSLALSAGCRSSALESRSISESPRLRIEVLGFDGCPSTPIARANTEAAVASLHLHAVVEYVDEQALPNDDLRRGWPAPTILVDGQDLFGMTPPKTATMSCRNYAGGVPSADEIAKALAALVAE